LFIQPFAMLATHFLRRRTTLLFITTFVVATSCKVTLLAPYDEITDKVITEMQEMTSTFFVTLESEPTSAAMTYEQQKPFYQQLKVKAATIRIRNNAIEKNKTVVGMITELEANVNRLETLHKGKANGLLLPEEVALLKDAFETQYTAIIRFMMALKQRAKAD
jgi:translation initiation factor IF-2